MKKNLRTTLICALSLLVLSLPAKEIPAGGESYLDGLVSEVLARNPDLARARESRSSALHLILPSGTLPDPKVGFSLSNFPTDDFSRSREPMTSIDVFFVQKFPFPGKLGLKEEIADIRSKQAGMSVAELENMLVYRTKRSYFRLYEISRAVDITKKTKAILGEFLEIARQRYTVGMALQQDVLRAHTAVSNIEKRLLDLDSMRIEVIALINTLRSMDLDSPVHAPDSLPVGDIPYPEEVLVESSVEANPTLARLKLKVDEGERGVSLARRERYPDFSLGARYRQREDRSDFVTGALTLDVPLYSFRKQSEVISSREFALKSSEREYESYVDRVSFSIREIVSDLDSLKKRVSLLETAILPEARHTVESALSSYRVGKLEFNSLVGAELDLFRYELELATLTSRYNERKAELWMVIGRTLTRKEVGDE